MNTNGTAKKPPDLAELREERKLVRARLALARDKALLESLALWDSFGGSDLFDRVRPRRNDDGDATRWVPPSVPSDRRHGANWPLWRTHYELDELRQESRLRCAANSHAKGLLANLVNNVINKGFAYKCKPKDPIDIKPAMPGMQDPRDQLAKVAQKVLDRFLRQNNWNGTIDPAGNRTVAGSREREIYRRIKRDGEAFLRFHCQPDGSLVVRVIEPEQVRDQGGGLASEGWSFGIRHSMSPYEDVECAEEYSVFWPDASAKGGAGNSDADEGTYELIDASEVLHLKGPDTDSTIKRGTPAFVYDTGAALDRASKLQRYVSIAASIRAASAEIWQHQTATQTQLQSMSDALAAYQRTDPTTGQSTNVERIGPGAIRRLPAGLELVNPAPDQSASYLEAGQGDLRQAASGECAPEFWLAETSSGNYSNLESAAAPAVRAGQCEQEYYKSAFARVAWQALQAAVRAGKLPRGLEEALVIEVEAPAVLHRNELEKAQEDQIGVEQGWKDRQTCAAERGLVWDTVQKNNEEFEQKQQATQLKTQMQQQKLGLQPQQPGAPGGGPPHGAGGPPHPPGGPGQGPPHPPGQHPPAPNGQHPPQPGQQHAQPPRPGQKMRMPLAERLQQLEATYGTWLGSETAAAAFRLLEAKASNGQREGRYGGWLAGEIAGAAFRLMESKDATGHEQKGKGAGGGQFTSGGGGGEGGNGGDPPDAPAWMIAMPAAELQTNHDYYQSQGDEKNASQYRAVLAWKKGASTGAKPAAAEPAAAEPAKKAPAAKKAGGAPFAPEHVEGIAGKAFEDANILSGGDGMMQTDILHDQITKQAGGTLSPEHFNGIVAELVKENVLRPNILNETRDLALPKNKDWNAATLKVEGRAYGFLELRKGQEGRLKEVLGEIASGKRKVTPLKGGWENDHPKSIFQSK